MKRNKQALLTLAVFALALAIDSMAASDGTFNTITERLTGWMTGSLGTTFALGSLAVGLAMGVVKQSVMSVVTGVAVALSASLGPNVLQGLFTASL
ncbi:TraA family conjugative transfer protein [Ralstonia pseudosolanacearum]|uniref:TraA family conjugative transfer protein n=1 Tax=Ralstonia pseudosolanacearum TaxID=1310165 RepID=UPI003CFB8822